MKTVVVASLSQEVESEQYEGQKNADTRHGHCHVHWVDALVFGAETRSLKMGYRIYGGKCFVARRSEGVVFLALGH